MRGPLSGNTPENTTPTWCWLCPERFVFLVVVVVPRTPASKGWCRLVEQNVNHFHNNVVSAVFNAKRQGGWHRERIRLNDGRIGEFLRMP
jgi:hypothetical protein